MKDDKEKTCWKCGYRQDVPGNAHISCVYDWEGSDQQPPPGNPHGIAKGWYYFPALYDPTWMQGQCPCWAEKRDREKAKKIDSLSMLGAIFGSVGRL